jgi:hypothetical protein
LVFVPLGEELDATGVTTTQYQTSGTPEKMDEALAAWDSVIDIAIEQLFWDFIFIIGGFLFLFNANALILRYFSNKSVGSKIYCRIPSMGMILTVLSRSFDAIENTISLYILTNTENYSKWAPAALNYVRTIKFTTVGLEYTFFILSILIMIYFNLQVNSKERVIDE